MGMFDELEINKKHLPDHLKENETGWQTKSYECLLDTLKITEEGELLVYRSDLWGNGEKIEETNYTGEIRFYNEVNNDWIEFVAFFERGKMIKLIQIQPNN